MSAVTGRVFVAQNPEQFTYDADGNMTCDGRFRYTWNAENRLVRAQELCAPTNRNPYTVAYAYDHKGRMVSKRITENDGHDTLVKSIAYVWDGWNIIREIQWPVASGQWPVVTDNVWGLDLDGTMQGAGGVGGLLAVQRSDCSATNSSLFTLHSSLYFPTYDANGNVSEYVSTDGSIVAHYDYSPFGETLIESGDLASIFTHRFSTKPWCPVTGLCEYQMRKYRPEIGRWMSRDPIGEALQRNVFSFIHNESVAHIDYIGLIAIYIGGAAERMQKQLEGFRKASGADIAYDFQQHDEIEEMIRKRYEADPCEAIILIGHSYGGDTALDVAAKFKEKPCICLYVVTLDPVSHFDPETWIWGDPRTDNIKEWIHVYQRAGLVDATVAIPIVGTLFGGVYAGIGAAFGNDNMVATGGGQWNHMRGADYNIRLPDEVDHHNVRGMLNQMIIDIDDKSKRVVDERGSPISVLDYIKQLKTMNCCEGRR